MKLYGIRYDKPGRDTKHIETGGLVHLYGVEINVLGHYDVITPIYSSRERAEKEIAEAEDNYLGGAPKVVVLDLEPEEPCEWCDWGGKYSEGSLQQKKLWTGGAVDVLPLLDWTFCPNCGRRLGDE